VNRGMSIRSSETNLVERIIAGDHLAFAELQRRYCAMLRSVARREFHLSEPDSEDVINDVLLQLIDRDYKCLRSYRGESSLATWLTAVLKHRCVDHLRETAMREDKVRARLDGQETRYDPYITIDLWQAIQTLPARDQVLVRLFFLEGRSYQEIAQTVKLPKNTIGSCIFRVKAQLRHMLLPVGQGETSHKRAGGKIG